ncbi:hypothetical protein T440DRAFT_542454 [Plenodomus tracheiphilus IPT5]|uniref:MARVEL domain-containing protein n=1 Tax=Plenodomus tracheiphilus IPT5 TaxID=1408161 RepID=A0A6A7BHX5_9PLEO|nr:hypothetical protein T440DRAFT_542454 [Plenodomus tracheiphilus IPT5]
MGVFDLLNKPLFSSRFKLHVHLLQVLLVSIAVGLSVPRLFIKNVPRTRSGTIALGMGAKSLILLAYLLASDYVPKFRRWHSYKAHMIIACLEVLFWSGVAGLIFQANRKSCVGITCTLSWIVMGVAVIIIQTEIWCSAVSIREFREYKAGIRTGASPTSKISSATSSLPRRHDDSEMQHLPSTTSSPSSVDPPKQTYTHAERQHSGHSGSMRSQGWQESRGEERSHQGHLPRYQGQDQQQSGYTRS